jgi:5-(carboxyamino)imidazole ribonucleotide synthase
MTARLGPILPGATVGVLGSGQLGRMFAIAARRLGYRVHTLSPEDDTPTGQVADLEVKAPYDDLDAIRRFASQVSVVTFEFENVPAAAAQVAAERVPVRPSGEALHVTQHRGREKEYLADAGLPLTPWARVRSQEELARALERIGAPAVLKTAGWGYDGKGQVKVATLADAPAAWARLGVDDAVVEAFVDLDRELSVVAARGLDGAFTHWGVMQNEHVDHILDVSVAPAPIPDALRDQAIELARSVLELLDVVGVLCVELFLARDGRLMVNELAPRPHNSGHLTVDASVTSQFEQQLRAICGLPLGSTELLRPAAMVNLLGDLWRDREPRWTKALALPDVKLHLYGKLVPRPGRKMGHITALGDTAEAARARALEARAAL